MVLYAASLHTANASTNISSNVSPLASLSLKTLVYSFNSLSLNLDISSSNASISSAIDLNLSNSLYSLSHLRDIILAKKLLNY